MPPDGALKGSAKNGELWALGGLPTVGKEFKIVTRVTGSGDFSAIAKSPDGSRLDPFRVTEHQGSNFDRPGDEWGLFFTFDRPGCWQIVVERGELTGVITLAVKP